MTFQNGSRAYIIENSRNICEVTEVPRNGDFFMIRFDNSGGIRLRGCRLYATREEAEASLPDINRVERKHGYRSPYDYTIF